MQAIGHAGRYILIGILRVHTRFSKVNKLAMRTVKIITYSPTNHCENTNVKIF